MITLENNKLVFRFPDLHKDAVCRVDFQRTLRLPDDNREYPLPPGLGRFPLAHVEDHAKRLPASWAEHGGALLPMYQAEALWLNFSGGSDSWDSTPYPFAVKIAAGKINAVTGEAWRNELTKDPQDYVVLPDQPWLDGFCVQKGLIRQFVAMPLGQGYTAEEQISGAAEHGGIQIIVYPMKRERYEMLLKKYAQESVLFCKDIADSCCEAPSMGLAPGGLMRQEIYEDEYGFDAWDTSNPSRCFVHILNSTQWEASTGKPVPGEPPSAQQYSMAGLPWFDYYDDNLQALDGSRQLARLHSVAAMGVQLGENPLPENDAVQPAHVAPLGPTKTFVTDGKW
jgi:hypothetical protein